MWRGRHAYEQRWRYGSKAIRKEKQPGTKALNGRGRLPCEPACRRCADRLGRFAAGATSLIKRAYWPSSGGTRLPILSAVGIQLRVGQLWVSLLFDLPVKTPETTERVDLVMGVTIDYKTSPQDYAQVGAGIFSPSDRLPGMGTRWTLATSSDTFNSTTLTWTRPRLPAEGRSYAFLVDVPAVEGSGDDMSFIRGRNVSVVVEMWPSGP